MLVWSPKYRSNISLEAIGHSIPRRHLLHTTRIWNRKHSFGSASERICPTQRCLSYFLRSFCKSFTGIMLNSLTTWSLSRPWCNRTSWPASRKWTSSPYIWYRWASFCTKACNGTQRWDGTSCARLDFQLSFGPEACSTSLELSLGAKIRKLSVTSSYFWMSSNLFIYYRRLLRKEKSKTHLTTSWINPAHSATYSLTSMAFRSSGLHRSFQPSRLAPSSVIWSWRRRAPLNNLARRTVSLVTCVWEHVKTQNTL